MFVPPAFKKLMQQRNWELELEAVKCVVAFARVPIPCVPRVTHVGVGCCSLCCRALQQAGSLGASSGAVETEGKTGAVQEEKDDIDVRATVTCGL